MRNNKFGFSMVEVLVIVTVVALVGVVGWKVYDSGQTKTPNPSSQSADQTPEVNSKYDLRNAEDYLNNQDIDKELDTSEIDDALNE